MRRAGYGARARRAGADETRCCGTALEAALLHRGVSALRSRVVDVTMSVVTNQEVRCDVWGSDAC